MKMVQCIVQLCCVLILGMGAAHAQPQKTFVEKSDPEAIALLKKVKGKYAKYDGISLKYTLTMDYGEDKEVQKGSLIQKGDQYHINNSGNHIINDGKTVWMYIKKQNEVQINDYIPEEDIEFSPQEIFSLGENDQYVYVITGQDSEGYRVELKPRDRDSEIKKVRVVVDSKQLSIKSVKVFSADGTRMAFVIEDVKNIKPTADDFRFDKSKYPGVKEIDLRD